jgi:FkbM family methyltransferase
MKQVVILGGACHGEEIPNTRMLMRGAYIYAIEPMKKNYEHIVKKYGDDDRLTILHKAIWIENGKKDMNMGRSHFAHSFYQKGNLIQGAVEEVETMDFAEFLQQFEEVDLLRLNIEGAEYEVLKHCFARGVLDRVKELNVEFHASKIPALKLLHNEVEPLLISWAQAHVLKARNLVDLTIGWKRIK